jgi:hypothetical protein
VQFGEIQGYVGPPEFLAGIDERYEVLSAPGLVTDLDSSTKRARHGPNMANSSACRRTSKPK